jgi:hypothetical protein
VALPLLDPKVDTFDSLRHRSSSCFAAVLAVAALFSLSDAENTVVYHSCRLEAEALIFNTLFGATVQLETIQAMIILTAYPEDVKLPNALTCAMNMARRIGLDTAVTQLEVELRSRAGENHLSGPPFSDSYSSLIRQARTWLLLVHLDQIYHRGVGKGSTNRGRLGNTLRSLSRHLYYPPFELHVLASIDYYENIGTYKASQMNT